MGITARARGITLTALSPAAEIAKTACQSGILAPRWPSAGFRIAGSSGRFLVPAGIFGPARANFGPARAINAGPTLKG